MTDSPKLFDRSRVTTDWTCPRRRWWEYEYGGRGIVPPTQAVELFYGTTLHDALAALATDHVVGCRRLDLIAIVAGQAIRSALMAASTADAETTDTVASEQQTLVEGIIRGFYKHVWPRLIGCYPKILAIEQEMLFPVEGWTFMARPDLVLEGQAGELVYVEYKSTSSKRESWVEMWDTAVQIHSAVKAIEAHLGRPVEQVIVQGLYKGYVDGYGKQTSPFCYGYVKPAGVRSLASVSYTYQSGARRTSTWTHEGGVKAWVEGMPEEALAAQFPQAPPIFVNEDLVSTFFAGQVMRENEIRAARSMLTTPGVPVLEAERQRIMLTVFPQHFESCKPAGRSPCPYIGLCFGQVEDPLQAGYEWRTPNHELERQALGEVTAT